MRALGAMLAVLFGICAPGADADSPETRILSYTDLDGWADDDHGAALAVFRKTCADLDDPEWKTLCALAGSDPDARGFFELFFRPVLIGERARALFTGYYEPELAGSRQRTPRFAHPLYRRPPELPDGTPWLTRAEIESVGGLRGRGLELAWLDDPVDVFFLQIQGSGRIRMTDGTVVRVGYGGRNGHPYRSVGAELARRGIVHPHQVSAAVIRNWVRRNPDDGRVLLHHNPSYIFFREVRGVDPADGPVGAMGRSLTALRSVAVDPAFTPLGAPVWVEKDGASPMRRLMIAQDTGGVIKGPQRVDVFYGTGDAAGDAAGTVRDPGRVIVLLPIQHAFALVPEG